MAKKRRRKKRQNTSLLSVAIAAVAIIWGVYTKGGQENLTSSSSSSTSSSAVSSAQTAKTVYGGLAKSDYQKLAQETFKSGGKGWRYVNNNHSTLVKSAWKVNRVIYSNLDSQNRTSSSNTAFLEQKDSVRAESNCCCVRRDLRNCYIRAHTGHITKSHRTCYQ